MNVNENYAGRIIAEFNKHAAAADKAAEEGRWEDSGFHAFMANAISAAVGKATNEDLIARFTLEALCV
jgi:hypothetical protein